VPPRRTQPPETPPDLPPQKAYEVLKAQLAKLQELKGRDYRTVGGDESEWFQLTAKLVMRSFGSGSPNYTAFRRASSAGSYSMVIGNYVDHGQNQSNFEIRVQAYESSLKSCIAELELDLTVTPSSPVASEENKLLVLISHSSKDEVLASALIDLLRSGLGLLPNQIRCSSVDGYRLPAGVNTDAQLRAEVRASKVLIGLITPNSLASPYVLFELGARWGAGEIMVPLLAGVTPDKLRGPLSGMNALLCSSEEQLHQALVETGAHLTLAVQSPAAYLKQLRNVIAEASRISIEQVNTASSPAAEKQRELRFSLTVVGTPPSPQMVNVRANQIVRVVHLDYLLMNGACIASDNLNLEGEVFDIPIEDHQIVKLWNTHRSDRNPNDHSGPAKLRVTLACNGNEIPYTLPIQMDAYFQHNTQYRRLSGSEMFRGE
jgi:hypothetical protein